MTKCCTKCCKELPATLEYFSSRKRNKDGLHEMCKDCRTERDKQYRQAHIERYRETTKAWKEANREHIDAVNKTYAETHKEHRAEMGKIWHQKNKERVSAKVKKWSTQNKERKIGTIYSWRENNKENYQAILKRYRDSHPEKAAMWAEQRRSRKSNLPATLTKEQWEQTRATFDNRCAYCGAGGKLQQEHFIPVASGGGYTAENIIPACAKCNASKKNKPFEIWYPKQQFYNADRVNTILRAVGRSAS